MRPTVKNFKFLKIQDNGGRHLGKIEKPPYLHNSLTNRHEIWHSDAVSPFDR